MGFHGKDGDGSDESSSVTEMGTVIGISLEYYWNIINLRLFQ